MLRYQLVHLSLESRLFCLLCIDPAPQLADRIIRRLNSLELGFDEVEIGLQFNVPVNILLVDPLRETLKLRFDTAYGCF